MKYPVVKVLQGELKGILKNENGKEYFGFLGIPYAEPPVGKLRFKDPVPIKPWNGVKDATEEGGVAAQIDMFTREYTGGDDCLYLNIFTPRLKNDGMPLPVMVNYHGGGFLNGSGNAAKFGPDYLMEEDVILVTSNYRLGVMGFLCTDPVNARGDMGLLDQQLSLQWVKDNIEAFNGDSNNITLFGISAGSASVEYHLLSEKSHQCFHKAILQSGSTLNCWARNPKPIESSKKLAELFGYKSDGNVFEFLEKIDTKDLVMRSAALFSDELLKEGILFPFVPAINVFNDNKGFLNDEPIDLLKSGRFHKVPTISGLCEKEGMMLRVFYASDEMNKIFKNGQFIECIPESIKKCFNNDELKSVYKQRPEDKNLNDYILDFLSDLGFNSGIFLSLEQRLKHNPNNEYFYQFAYDGNINMLKTILQFKDAGACHGDDYTYLGPNSLVPIDNALPEDIRTIHRMVKMWTDFAKIGNPTPNTTELVTEKWLPITSNEFRYLDIRADLKMSVDLCEERRNLWMKINSTI